MIEPWCTFALALPLVPPARVHDERARPGVLGTAIFVARVAGGEVRRYEIPAGTPSPMGLAGGRRWSSLSPDGRRLAPTLEEAP
jgi:hypothetical protein